MSRFTFTISINLINYVVTKMFAWSLFLKAKYVFIAYDTFILK